MPKKNSVKHSRLEIRAPRRNSLSFPVLRWNFNRNDTFVRLIVKTSRRNFIFITTTDLTCKRWKIFLISRGMLFFDLPRILQTTAISEMFGFKPNCDINTNSGVSNNCFILGHKYKTNKESLKHNRKTTGKNRQLRTSKPFVCNFCNQRFTTSANRGRHIKQIHMTGPDSKIYPCALCPRAYNRRDNLQYHLRHMHGITPKSQYV